MDLDFYQPQSSGSYLPGILGKRQISDFDDCSSSSSQDQKRSKSSSPVFSSESSEASYEDFTSDTSPIREQRRNSSPPDNRRKVKRFYCPNGPVTPPQHFLRASPISEPKHELIYSIRSQISDVATYSSGSGSTTNASTPRTFPLLTPYQTDDNNNRIDINNDSELKAAKRAKRKCERDKKRLAKEVRKDQLRQEIQRFIDAGVKIDDEDVIVKPLNRYLRKVPLPSILKTVKGNEKYVLYKDGLLPGETSSDEDTHTDRKLRKMRKNRVTDRVKMIENRTSSELPCFQQKEPPPAPSGAPPRYLLQPIPKSSNLMFSPFLLMD